MPSPKLLVFVHLRYGVGILDAVLEHIVCEVLARQPLAVDDLDVTVEKLRVTRRERKASSELGFLAAQLPSL